MSLTTLPREIILIITSYLNHEEYLRWSQVRVIFYHVLTNIIPLQRRLKEFDLELTRLDLLCALKHLSRYVYLEYKAVKGHSYLPASAVRKSLQYGHVLVDDYQQIRVPLSRSGNMTHDIFNRVWTEDNKRLIIDGQPVRAHSVYHLSDSDLFLYYDTFMRNGSLYPFKVDKVADVYYENKVVLYRNKAGFYYLFSPISGLHQYYRQLVRQVEIQQVVFSRTYEKREEYVEPKYILYRNGDLDRVTDGYFCSKKHQWIPAVIKQINTNVSKIIPYGGDQYLALDHRGCFEHIIGNQIIDRINKVYDIAQVYSMIYFLMEDGVCLYTTHDERRHDLISIYAATEKFRELSVYGCNDKIVIRLRR